MDDGDQFDAWVDFDRARDAESFWLALPCRRTLAADEAMAMVS
jgi:hypothetical protein